MIVAIRALATLVDVGAMLAMAVAFALIERRVGAAWAGVGAPPWLQPWHDVLKLSRKRRVRPVFASPGYAAWPVIALTASAAALVIVPGFAFGLVTARLATIPVIVGLLGVAVLARLASLLESGDGARGVAAVRAARRWLAAMAVWLAGLGALAVRAGSDMIAGIGGTLAVQPGTHAVVVLVGLGLVLAMAGWVLPDPGDYAGAERALFQIEATLRLVVLVALVVDVLAPSAMADARLVATWPIGLLAWLVAMIALGGVVMLVGARRYAIGLGGLCVGAGLVLVVGRDADLALLLMIAGGVAGVFGLGWLIRPGSAVRAAGLVQIGVALIGLGLGDTMAAALILGTVALARLAVVLAPGQHSVVAASMVALAGLPPFGGFAGDFMVVRAMNGAVGPWVAGVVVAGLALAAIVLIGRLPRGTMMAAVTLRAVAAGMCLVGALLLGLSPWLTPWMA